MTYQGWTNYPTFAVKLWLDNDEGLYNYSRILNRKHRDLDCLAHLLRDRVYELMPQGLAEDLINYALELVNWEEIALAIRENEDKDDDIEE